MTEPTRAIILSALEPFAKAYDASVMDRRSDDDPLMLPIGMLDDLALECTVGDLRRAAALYDSLLTAEAEANVSAIRFWDAPGFEACVKAERERLASPSALTEWRTMDSAPKDGSLFIAYNSRMDEMAIVGWTAEHDLEHGGTWTDAGGKNCGNALRFNAQYFDWWRPRPDTSATAKGGS